jgi:hypothetical protein
LFANPGRRVENCTSGVPVQSSGLCIIPSDLARNKRPQQITTLERLRTISGDSDLRKEEVL